MVGPSQKRRAVQAVVQAGLCSERRACRHLGIHRSSRVIIEDYRWYYNEERPHGGLGYRTPKQAFNEAQTGDTKMSNAVPAA